jgi:hypothetical protein
MLPLCTLRMPVLLGVCAFAPPPRSATAPDSWPITPAGPPNGIIRGRLQLGALRSTAADQFAEPLHHTDDSPASVAILQLRMRDCNVLWL